MTKKKETQEVQEIQELTNEVSFFAKFPRPYIFEGNEYSGIDLSGLDNLTATDLAVVERTFAKRGNVDALKENNITFCLLIAQRATNLPFEFFDNLPIPHANRIKMVVSAFLMEAA